MDNFQNSILPPPSHHPSANLVAESSPRGDVDDLAGLLVSRPLGCWVAFRGINGYWDWTVGMGREACSCSNSAEEAGGLLQSCSPC